MNVLIGMGLTMCLRTSACVIHIYFIYNTLCERVLRSFQAFTKYQDDIFVVIGTYYAVWKWCGVINSLAPVISAPQCSLSTLDFSAVNESGPEQSIWYVGSDLTCSRMVDFSIQDTICHLF